MTPQLTEKRKKNAKVVLTNHKENNMSNSLMIISQDIKSHIDHILTRVGVIDNTLNSEPIKAATIGQTGESPTPLGILGDLEDCQYMLCRIGDYLQSIELKVGVVKTNDNAASLNASYATADIHPRIQGRMISHR